MSIGISLSIGGDSYSPVVIETPDVTFGAALVGWRAADALGDTIALSAFSQLLDLSGHGAHLNGGGNTNNPSVAVDTINGHRCADMISANLQYFRSAIAMNLTQGFMYASIFKPRAVAATGNDRFLMCAENGNSAQMTYNDGGSASLSIDATGTSVADPSAPVDGNVIAAIGAFSAAASFTLINRFPKFGVGTDIGAAGVGTMLVGLHPGASVDQSFNGVWLEDVVVAGVPTDAKIAKFQKYLFSRAGV